MIPVTILTEKSSTIIINDTLKINDPSTSHHLTLQRSNNQLKIETQTDSITKIYYIKSKISHTTSINGINGFLRIPGIIVDLLTKKAYTYPRYINFSENETYLQRIDSSSIKKKILFQ